MVVHNSQFEATEKTVTITGYEAIQLLNTGLVIDKKFVLENNTAFSKATGKHLVSFRVRAEKVWYQVGAVLVDNLSAL